MICKISLRVELWNWSWGLYRYETHSYEYFHVMKKKRIHLVSYNICTYIKQKNPMTKDEVKFSFLLAYRIPNFTWVRILFSFLFSSFRFFFFLVKSINRWSIYVKLWLNIKAPSLHSSWSSIFRSSHYTNHRCRNVPSFCELSIRGLHKKQLRRYLPLDHLGRVWETRTMMKASWMFESQHSFNEDEEAKQDEFLLLGGYQLLRLVASDGFLKRFLPTSSSTVPILRGVRLLRLRQLAGTFVMARCVFLLKIQT